MAIIKCDDVDIDAIIPTGSFEAAAVTTEEYVEQNKVSLGKTLLAVESGFFLEDTTSQAVLSKVDERYLETRPQDISDTLRADSNRYWTLDQDGNMKYMNVDVGQTLTPNVNIGFPTPPFWMARYTSRTEEVGTTELGLPIIKEEYVITEWADSFGDILLWMAFVGGGEYIDISNGNTFSRPTPLVPADGETFTDHAFRMNTPFSKKELEMFANIDGHVDVADVESDYDFFAKAYEEGITPTNVPENALPHLYTEVQRGESEAENTIIRGSTEAGAQVEEGFFREWINTVLSSQTGMDALASAYENVAILDSVVNEESIIDSTGKSTSAFEILMAYANRENLFPMNINIEVNTESASDLMFEAEDVGMVDDIVRLLMGEGNVEPVIEPVDEPVIILTEDVLESGYNMVADSMAELNQNKAVTDAMSDNLVAQIGSMIAAVKDGSYLDDQAMELQSQLSAMSNGSISGVDLAQVQAVVQDLTNLVDSNSLMNSLVQTSNMVKKL
tara:strand:+ start:846 stop:2354 length:1509 start_codon:yes stop_codon:yes gene_type:complete